MVESARLESALLRKGYEGSNPSLSAIFSDKEKLEDVAMSVAERVRSLPEGDKRGSEHQNLWKFQVLNKLIIEVNRHRLKTVVETQSQ